MKILSGLPEVSAATPDPSGEWVGFYSFKWSFFKSDTPYNRFEICYPFKNTYGEAFMLAKRTMLADLRINNYEICRRNFV